MTIEEARQQIFEVKKRYYSLNVPTDNLIFLFSYKDYSSIIKDARQMEYSHVSTQMDMTNPNVVGIGESKISWSPIVEDGEIITAIREVLSRHPLHNRQSIFTH